jgi:hypothetical protein
VLCCQIVAVTDGQMPHVRVSSGSNACHGFKLDLWTTFSCLPLDPPLPACKSVSRDLQQQSGICCNPAAAVANSPVGHTSMAIFTLTEGLLWEALKSASSQPDLGSSGCKN